MFLLLGYYVKQKLWEKDTEKRKGQFKKEIFLTVFTFHKSTDFTIEEPEMWNS